MVFASWPNNALQPTAGSLRFGFGHPQRLKAGVRLRDRPAPSRTFVEPKNDDVPPF